MDLISGYLLILLVLFMGNIALMLGNYKISHIKILLISALFSIIIFVLMYCAGLFKSSLYFFMGYFNYFFIVVAVLQFMVLIYYNYDSEKNLKSSIFTLVLIFLVLVVILSSQSNLISFESCLLFSLVAFTVLFVVYQVSKLLTHAKRDYPIVVGEYMSLSSILIFIFALTYHSTLSLDYSMFTSFLILTPTYQLVYVCISIGVVLMIGLLYNDKQMKGGKN
ncbi:MAG: peptide ABC transporter permease [Methanobrevibacter sp.]|nr:peptide ABC transporter permease [Methanobrevibacter sp.]